MKRTSHLQGLLIVVALVALGGLYLLQNNQPALTVSIPAASATPFDAPPPEWQAAIEGQLARANTPVPTPALEITEFVPPTLPAQADADDALVEPEQILRTPWPTPTPGPTLAPSPTRTGPTPFPSPTGLLELIASDDEQIEGFAPPPEQVPLSPHANDHFWLMRPVDASANSASLFYYPFGSNGAQNQWRVHHGVDMPNPVGEPARAGGSGVVIWAGRGEQVIVHNDVQIYPAYGNVVIIEHDFGYRGQKIWTLYAHLEQILVEEGDRVKAGDIVGLIGGTGDVSGPHVHLEVRVGTNHYFYVYNPLLWIAPYIGHGVVAGSVTYPDGSYANDVTVTLSQRGRVVETTFSYTSPKELGNDDDPWHVVPDPAWQENFVLGDIPEGEYTITASVNGQRITRDITVRAGTTNFVNLGLDAPATPQPIEEDATEGASNAQ